MRPILKCSAWVVCIALAACGEENEAAGTPPGIEPGVRLKDVRAIEPAPRLSTACVLEVRGPWVLLSAGGQGDRASAVWTNFNHVCSYQLDPQR